MMALHYDSYAAVKRLTAKGYSEEQAEAFVEEVSVVHDSQGEQLATKVELSEQEHRTESSISDVRMEIRDMKVDLLKWMFGGFATMTTLLVAILFKLSSLS